MKISEPLNPQTLEPFLKFSLCGEEKNMKANKIIFIFLLTVLATLGNYFKYSLYGGIDIIFGSIFVMIIAIRYGTLWTVVASFLSSLVTYYHWNHPYAIIVFVAEAFYVSTRYSKTQSNISVHDAIFWSIPGVLIIPSYYFLLGMDINIVLAIYLKSAVNGTANAVIASFLFHTYQYAMFKFNKPHRKMTFKNFTLELLVLMVIIPLIATIIFVFNINASDRNKAIKEELVEVSNSVTALINEYIANNFQKLIVFSKIISLFGNNALNDKNMQGFLLANDDFTYISLIDSNFNTLLRVYKDKSKIKDISPIDHNLKKYIKERYKNQPSELLFDKELGSYMIGFLIKKEYSISESYLLGLINSGSFKRQIEKHFNNRDFSISLLDNTGKVIASTNTKYETGITWIERRDYNPTNKDIVKQTTDYHDKTPKAVIISKSYYTIDKTINLEFGWRLIVDFPIQQLHKLIIKEFNYIMLFTFIVMLISIGFANYLHRITVDPITEIISETTNIKEKVYSNTSISDKHFFIKELNSLMNNYVQAYN
ncbi:MAG: hypothetical protein N2738_06195, partial [Thermodesulfovibrionales bacterium]|nr:hypothetical protein [Thermodesulfovibrionales bacterium]